MDGPLFVPTDSLCDKSWLAPSTTSSTGSRSMEDQPEFCIGAVAEWNKQGLESRRGLDLRAAWSCSDMIDDGT